MKKTFVTPMGKNAPGPARLDATATEVNTMFVVLRMNDFEISVAFLAQVLVRLLRQATNACVQDDGRRKPPLVRGGAGRGTRPKNHTKP